MEGYRDQPHEMSDLAKSLLRRYLVEDKPKLAASVYHPLRVYNGWVGALGKGGKEVPEHCDWVLGSDGKPLLTHHFWDEFKLLLEEDGSLRPHIIEFLKLVDFPEGSLFPHYLFEEGATREGNARLAEERTLGCVHGRPPGRMCPHCLGLRAPDTDTEVVITTSVREGMAPPITITWLPQDD
jgi:hypothetical protein